MKYKKIKIIKNKNKIIYFNNLKMIKISMKSNKNQNILFLLLHQRMKKISHAVIYLPSVKKINKIHILLKIDSFIF